MDKFYIITNETKDKDFAATNVIKTYLEARGKICYIGSGMQDNENTDKKYRFTNPDCVPEDTECGIVLGGDGTLIQAARDLVDKEIPLIGVNLGTLGFLAETQMSNIETALDSIIEGHYNVEERMMLTGVVESSDRVIDSNIALNDIVISRGSALTVMNFEIYVNGQFLNRYRADGIIISTPTGSTGYNLSAGGPIVEPNASLILMTPICPHTLNTRSIVLSAEDEISIKIGECRNASRDERFVAFDGDTTVLLDTGDSVIIKKSVQQAKILKINSISFLETLRKKMSDK